MGGRGDRCLHIVRSLEGNRTDTPTITQVDDPPSLCSGRKSFVRTKSYLEIQDIKERRAAFWLQDTEQGPRGPARAASCLPRCSRAEAGTQQVAGGPAPILLSQPQSDAAAEGHGVLVPSRHVQGHLC